MQQKVALLVRHDLLVLEDRVEVCTCGLKFQRVAFSVRCTGRYNSLLNLLLAIRINFLHVAHEEGEIAGKFLLVRCVTLRVLARKTKLRLALGQTLGKVGVIVQAIAFGVVSRRLGGFLLVLLSPENDAPQNLLIRALDWLRLERLLLLGQHSVRVGLGYLVDPLAVVLVATASSFIVAEGAHAEARRCHMDRFAGRLDQGLYT